MLPVNISLLDAVRRLTAKIAKDEMNAVGGVGYFDHFTHAAACVNATTEPCDVVHWMRVNRDGQRTRVAGGGQFRAGQGG